MEERMKSKTPKSVTSGINIDKQSRLSSKQTTVYNSAGDHISWNINSSKSSEDDPSPCGHFNVKDPASSFHGRESFISTLHRSIIKIFDTPKDSLVASRTIVIWGIGGIGKTETVRKYIHDYKTLYKNIVWINGANEITMKSCFRELAEKKLNLKDLRAESDDYVIGQVFQKVFKHKTLFIFDNGETWNSPSDAKDGIRDFLPTSFEPNWKLPVILIRSRNQSWDGIKTVLPLNALSEGEATSFVTNYTNILQPGQAEEINKFCQGLPLLLRQICDYLNEDMQLRQMVAVVGSAIDFLDSFKTAKKKCLTKDPEQFVPCNCTFVSVLTVTFEKLLRLPDGPSSIYCLQIMSCMSPDNIPKELLLGIISSNSSVHLEKSIPLLKKFNLIQVHDNHYEVLRLVQEVTRNLTKSGFFNYHRGCHESYDQLLKAVASSTYEYFCNNWRNLSCSSLCHSFTKNAIVVLTHLKELYSYPEYHEYLQTIAEFVGINDTATSEEFLKNIQTNKVQVLVSLLVRAGIMNFIEFYYLFVNK